ncbi:uncharacterized protein LOC124924318 [Impatiens glandulifera]|uniref:uncharacterized protein LOC124924318 n=1 Tax=Impatiens glandulifera TaxID=253017 RepID=UPI001FB1895E|nr:uncharacterized protein LOC124924318 [Impatiens glandulifera]
MEEELKLDWKKIYSVFVIDDVYEHINAPQWVDFSLIDVPDNYDHLWFCTPECNHPKTAQDFLKQLPSCTKLKKSASCNDDEVIRDSNLNRRRMLKKGSNTKCESDCENHNPNLSSKNLFAASSGDHWPITEFYNEFKRKLTIRTKTTEQKKKKKNPLLFDSVKEKSPFLPKVKAHFIRLVKLSRDDHNKIMIKGRKDAHNHPHQNKLIEFHRSSTTKILQQVGGRGGILQELEDEQRAPM